MGGTPPLWRGGFRLLTFNRCESSYILGPMTRAKDLVVRNPDDYGRLIADAQSSKFSGWDFSWLKNRLTEEAPPWDYKQKVSEQLPRIKSLLDLGTGGGEF